MPHYVQTGPSHFWLSPCPWMANNRQQSQFWTYRLFKRRSGQTSHAYPYEKLLVKSAGQRSPIFEPRVVTYHLITVILHSSGFRWRAGYMGISPQYGQMKIEELTQQHNNDNIYLDILGKTNFSEFLLLRHNHKESQFMSREAFPKKLYNLSLIISFWQCSLYKL